MAFFFSSSYSFFSFDRFERKRQQCKRKGKHCQTYVSKEKTKKGEKKICTNVTKYIVCVFVYLSCVSFPFVCELDQDFKWIGLKHMRRNLVTKRRHTVLWNRHFPFLGWCTNKEEEEQVHQTGPCQDVEGKGMKKGCVCM